MRQTKMANWEIEKKWFVVDATDVVLGKLSAQVATVLMGRNRPQFTPHLDLGDNVIVINATGIKLTGNKLKDKIYYNHSGFPGGLRARTAGQIMEKNPSELVKKAIWGMIPHNKLGRKIIKKLHIYAGAEHEHEAQKPVAMEITL